MFGLGCDGEVTREKLCDLYPAMTKMWKQINVDVRLDHILDQDIDFHVDLSQVGEDNLSLIGEALHRLFEIYMEKANITQTTKLTRQMQSNFDVFLAFVVRKRKDRIASWVSNMCGGNIPDEWKQVDQQLMGRFQALFRRCQHRCGKCQHRCGKCQLGCMESAIHPVGADHKWGLSHTCRGRCEFCDSSSSTSLTPWCTCEAGHEGMCEREAGDRT